MGRKAIPLTTKERFIAVMSSRGWDGSIQKSSEAHMLFMHRSLYDPKTGQTKRWVEERQPSQVRKLLYAREKHRLVERMQKFLDAVKEVKGFETGLEARKFIDEWRRYGDTWSERQILYFIEAKEQAEKLTDAEMEALILAASL